MLNKHDISRNACQLFGAQAKCGYDWWWHSFTGHHAVTGEEKAFFIEFFRKAMQELTAFLKLYSLTQQR